MNASVSTAPSLASRVLTRMTEALVVRADNAWQTLLALHGEASRAQLLADYNDAYQQQKRKISVASEPLQLHQNDVRCIETQCDAHLSQALTCLAAVRVLEARCRDALAACQEDRAAEVEALCGDWLQLAGEMERHVTALTLLHNLKDRHYTLRARKGGHLKARKPKRADEERVILAIIEAFLYHQWRWASRALHQHPWWLIDPLAAHLYRLQAGIQLFTHYQTLDDFTYIVCHLITEKSNKLQQVIGANEGRQGLMDKLRPRPYRQLIRLDNVEYWRNIPPELVEAAEREGDEKVRNVLRLIFEDRFGGLSETVHRYLETQPLPSFLPDCLPRLWTATSAQEVLGLSE